MLLPLSVPYKDVHKTAINHRIKSVPFSLQNNVPNNYFLQVKSKIEFLKARFHYIQVFRICNLFLTYEHITISSRTQSLKFFIVSLGK